MIIKTTRSWETRHGKFSLVAISTPDALTIIVTHDKTSLQATHSTRTVKTNGPHVEWKIGKLIDELAPAAAVATKARRLLAQIVKEHTS
jgi:hypothetical protein